LLPAADAGAWVAGLARIDAMQHGGRKLRRIGRAPDVEELRDLLAELRYAFVFETLGFAITCEPAGDARGPDFALARADATFNLEVHRFRPVSEQVSDTLAPDGTLLPYGRGEKDVRRALYVIFEKFSQLGTAPGVVALWSDDDGIEEIETAAAVRELLEETRASVRVIPPNIICVVFGSADVHAGSGQQFYCVPVNAPRSAWSAEIERTLWRTAEKKWGSA
jgi:hypothetical protein